MTSPIIAPSILASDFSRFGEEALRTEQAGGDWLHVDIMDGHFVPNISFGPGVTAALRRSTRLPLDVHLMIERPDLHLDAFIKAGADRITVHAEAKHDLIATLTRIRAAGLAVGVAINPPTHPRILEACLGEVDQVLCMTVMPGFGGQAFMDGALENVRWVAAHPLRQKNAYRIEVDGGIDLQTATRCAAAGADTFVAGTSLFREQDLRLAIHTMREALAAA